MPPINRVAQWSLVAATALTLTASDATFASPPHIVLVMADDMGWGQTGYRNHPVLKTPNLDAMAAAGLRFERFYAASAVCSPTRASVLTGRTPDRTGVLSHGYALRQQEKTVAQALQSAGYATAHFGKWHLSGYRGAGVPVLASDPRHPGKFGFDEWLSVTNFFDVDPMLSRQGKVEYFTGDSSEVVVDQACELLRRRHDQGQPLFVVIWFGSPHNPFRALENDRAAFDALEKQSAQHYGELAAMDRAMGTLRTQLRSLGIANDTLLVFCSDNGGLANIKPETVGGLRGHKGSVYEGGLRVPGIFEWPAVIRPRVTRFPASTSDLFPTIAEIVGLPREVFVEPLDGISLLPLFHTEQGERTQPLGFRYGAKTAWIDNRHKLISTDWQQGRFELYDLDADPAERRDLSEAQPELLARMKRDWQTWNESVEASFAGSDYPEKRVVPADPVPRPWHEAEEYQLFLPEWGKRWEIKRYLQLQ